MKEKRAEMKACTTKSHHLNGQPEPTKPTVTLCNDAGAYLSTIPLTLQHLLGPHFLDQAALCKTLVVGTHCEPVVFTTCR